MRMIKSTFRVKFLIGLALFMLIGASVAQEPPGQQLELRGSRSSMSLPSNDPYCGDNGYIKHVLGIDDSKCTAVTGVDFSNVPNNVVDWVLVELRAVAKGAGVDAATEEKVIERRPAFLLDTGEVLDAERYRGSTACTDAMDKDQAMRCPLVEFSSMELTGDTIEMDLYAAVRHVNHLDIISSEAMTTQTSANRYAYDFTTGISKARGGSVAMKEVAGRKAVMFVGDVNGDANINAADYLQILGSHANTITTDTQIYDINYDGVINSTDTQSSILRDNLGRAVQLPRTNE